MGNIIIMDHPLIKHKISMLRKIETGTNEFRQIVEEIAMLIKAMFIIAAPKGLEVLQKAHPDVQIFIGNLDRELNEHAYICPGLGDAGDRIFGTK